MNPLKDKEEIYAEAEFKAPKRSRNYIPKEPVREKKEETKPEVNEWAVEDKELVDWFLNLDPSLYPKPPFILKPGERVIDFFIALREEIERGPNQYRARNGIIQDDLKCLRKIIEKEKNGQE